MYPQGPYEPGMFGTPPMTEGMYPQSQGPGMFPPSQGPGMFPPSQGPGMFPPLPGVQPSMYPQGPGASPQATGMYPQMPYPGVPKPTKAPKTTTTAPVVGEGYYNIDARLDRIEREIIEINRRLNTLSRRVRRVENFLNIRDES